MPGLQLSWSWGCLGGHWAALGQPLLVGKDSLVAPVLAGWVAANSSQSQISLLSCSTSGIHLPGEFTGKTPQWEAPHLPLAPHLPNVRPGERVLPPRSEFPEGGDDGSVSRRARGARWQLVPTRARSAVTPTLAAASPAASCSAVLEQLPVGRC